MTDDRLLFIALVSAVIPKHPASKLSNFQAFTLTLMKVRLNLRNFDLGFRFGISESTLGRLFCKWIEIMDIRLKFLITWPDRETLQATMPLCFRVNYGLKVTSIIDCFELFIHVVLIRNSLVKDLLIFAQYLLHLLDLIPFLL